MLLDGILIGKGMDGDGMIYYVLVEKDIFVNSCQVCLLGIVMLQGRCVVYKISVLVL